SLRFIFICFQHAEANLESDLICTAEELRNFRVTHGNKNVDT
uniref:Uncharacterized protein n=1 Tax=Parascaris univalens TaxID=6257 RepID=A0A915C656_PARUN